MKAFIYFLLTLFFVFSAYAENTEDIFTGIDYRKNYSKNAEYERSQYPGTSYTMQVARTSTNPLSGGYSVSMTATASGQTFYNESAPLGQGLSGKVCESSFDFAQPFSSVINYETYAMSGASVIASSPLVLATSSATTRTRMTWNCIPSQVVRTYIRAIGTSWTALVADKFYTGEILPNYSSDGAIYTGSAPVVVSGTTISMTQSSSGVSGFLSGNDYNTFQQASSEAARAKSNIGELIQDGDAERNNPIVFYTTAATAKPTTSGTLGAVSLTAVVSSTAPLDGTKSFIISKATGNAQGQQVAIPFTITSGTIGVFDIEIKYRNVSGIFEAGSVSGVTITNSSLIPYIYDVDNGTWIEPSSFIFTASSTTFIDSFRGSFQTNSNSRNYRLLLHQASTNTAAYSMQFEFSIKPSDFVYGTYIGNWETVTGVTGSWTSNTTYQAKRRQVGDSFEWEMTALLTGSPNATQLFFNMPTGFAIDTGKLNSGSSVNILGSTLTHDNGASLYEGLAIIVNNAVSNPPVYPYYDTGSSLQGHTATQPVTFVAGDSVSMRFIAPTVGRAATTQLASNDPRKTSFYAVNSGVAIATVETPINSGYTILKDSHGAFSGGTYTIPKAAYCKVSAAMVLPNTGSTLLRLYINDVNTRTASDYTNTSPYYAMPTIIYARDFTAGERLRLSLVSSVAGSTDGTFSYFSVDCDNGSSSFAATENVSLTYRNNSGQSIAHNTITTVTGWTKLDDTHGAFNPATGIFTAPYPGRYTFSFGITFGDTVAANDRLVRLKDVTNNTDIIDQYRPYNVAGSGVTMQTATIELPVVAGQQFRIEVYQGSGSPQPISASLQRNFISIRRSGL